MDQQTSTMDHQECSGLKKLSIDMWNWTSIAVKEFTETATGNIVGQTIVKVTERILWTVEKSAQWALPLTSNDESEKNMVPAELIRPLPWFLFLPLLLFLRLLREGISFGALLLGKEPIRPATIVRFIQSLRRSLRILKYQGLRNIRAKNNGHVEETFICIPETLLAYLKWFSSKVQSMFCFDIVKYCSCRDNSTLVRKNSGELVQVVSRKQHAKKRQLPQEETVGDRNDDNILKRLITDMGDDLESESDDSDFSLKNISDKGDDTSQTSSDSDTDVEDKENDESSVDQQIQNNDTENAESTVKNGHEVNELKVNGTMETPTEKDQKITENFLQAETMENSNESHVDPSPMKSKKNLSSENTNSVNGNEPRSQNGNQTNHSSNNGENHENKEFSDEVKVQ